MGLHRTAKPAVRLPFSKALSVGARLRKFLIMISLLVGVLFAYGAAYYLDSARYRSTEFLQCSQDIEIMISRPYWPLLSSVDLTTGLELYVGGWLEVGSLTISGTPFRDESGMFYSTDAGVIEVSRAQIGEWYNDSFEMRLRPGVHSSCAIKVVYKFKGVL